MTSFAFLVGFLFLDSKTTLSLVDIALGAFVALAFIAAVRKRDAQQFYHLPQNFFVALFAIFALAYAVAQPGGSHLFLLKTLYLVAGYAAIHYFSQKEENLRDSLMSGYAFGAAASACLGLVAYAVLVANPSASSVPLVWIDGVRLSGFFDDPVVYGAFLAPALLFFFYRLEATKTTATRIAIMGVIGAVYINLVLTGSRGAWLNALVAGAVALALSTQARHFLLSVRGAIAGAMFLVAALVVIFVIPVHGTTYYAATLQARAASSDAPRFETWRESPALLAHRPIFQIPFGSGGGSFPSVSSRKLDAHNVYLKTLYEYGALGLALIAGFFFFAARAAIRRAQKSPVFVIVAASLAGIAAQGMFVDVLHWRHLWLLAGLA